MNWLSSNAGNRFGHFSVREWIECFDIAQIEPAAPFPQVMILKVLDVEALRHEPALTKRATAPIVTLLKQSTLACTQHQPDLLPNRTRCMRLDLFSARVLHV